MGLKVRQNVQMFVTGGTGQRGRHTDRGMEETEGSLRRTQAMF
jgi:hypothetical protein